MKNNKREGASGGTVGSLELREGASEGTVGSLEKPWFIHIQHQSSIIYLSVFYITISLYLNYGKWK
jgi:hypothetical protein